MIGSDIRFCDYCQCSIVAGQRWVREKIYESRPTNPDPAYRHFHAEVFGGQELSCWVKYWTQREIIPTGLNAGNEQAMRLVA